MKFTLSWLKDHLDTSASLDEIADKLTLIGLEVEALVDPSETFANFEVAEIIATAPHPEADRLQICTVKSGDGEQQLVCGAPNARAGLVGILAQEGAVIPASGMVLGKAKIRGVESRGMMCSGAELGLNDDHDGIIELEAGASIGSPAAVALGLDDPM
ncbi:MAG: phenylalanine--tRNA ligase subunit beta, partial [Pseudomonadota bacterium]|nr:phenylalanine--tRNA ligase subunit beta [Pseudomonadota bacterium]